MTTDEALEHPYLSAYVCKSISPYTIPNSSVQQHDPEDEPTVTPLSPDYFEFDRKAAYSPFSFFRWLPSLQVHKDDLSKDQLKGMSFDLDMITRPLTFLAPELLYAEVMSFVPSI